MISWEDLRLVLLVARTGSLSGAAQKLGINVSTCSRRLDQFEHEQNVVCFLRLPSGVEMTAAGGIIVAHAEAMEVQEAAIQRALATTAGTHPARVTVTCPDSLGAALVMPAMNDWIARQRNLALDLVTGNQTIELSRGEAHLALRFRPPSDGGLKVRKIAVIGYGLFASAAYLEEAPAISSLSDLEHHQLIGIRSSYPDYPLAVWWAEQCMRGTVAARADGTLDRQQCAASDLGIAMLPKAIGRRTGLVPVLGGEELARHDVYLLAEPSALRMSQVRKVAERLAQFAREHAAELG